MGLFSLSASTPDEQRANEVRSGAVAPDRSERAKCWEARDVYFSCLDKANIIDPVKEDKAARNACSSQTMRFEQDCATSWVRATHLPRQNLQTSIQRSHRPPGEILQAVASGRHSEESPDSAARSRRRCQDGRLNRIRCWQRFYSPRDEWCS